MDVGAFILGLGLSRASGESVLNTPKKPDEERGGFWSALEAACAEKSKDSGLLYSDGRKALMDEDIAELAEKYDPRNMTGAQYEEFLTGLEDKGVINSAEHTRMRSYFMADTGSDVSGNLLKKLQNMPVTRDSLDDRSFLETLVDRMDVVRNGRSFMEEARDTGSNMWVSLRQFVVEKGKENEELRKEEEKIELLSIALDAMTGRIQPSVSVTEGLRLGMGAEYDIVKSGRLSEMQAYLIAGANRPADDTPEEPEEDTGSKIQEVGSSSAEKLYANSERRHNLTDDDLAQLAGKYNPNNMDAEQYDKFLEEMVELGVASADTIRRIGYHGMTRGAEGIEYVSELPGAPVFTRSPIDNDIEGWIQNRMLWKPGITRESAKRMGLSNQFEIISEEEKTLSKIAAVLADVRRQRYPSVTL